MTRTTRVSLFALTAIITLSLSACDRDKPASTTATPTASAATSAAAEPADPEFVGKIWVSTTPGAPLGSMMIFMPDRTLIMDSCFETYRLSKWGVAGKDIRWLEDTIPIEAKVDMPRPNQLILRVAGQDKDQSFATASVPYVCPDMPR